MEQYLCVVARDQPDLYYYLARNLAGDKEVRMLFDRRSGERRRYLHVQEPERRGADRRGQPGIEDDLRSIGFAIIRQQDCLALS
ncbi:MAG: hypothetical protein ACE5JD_16890 [Candidatus Methylomirabilia bacterium]